MKQLKPHEERMLAEGTELRNHMVSLCSFLSTTTFYSLPEKEQELIQRQLQAMIIYSTELSRCLAGFENIKEVLDEV